jgi:hypothetical protein
MSSAALSSRPPQREPRQIRNPRISLRRRFRAIYRNLADLLREIIAAPGHRRAREDFMQAAAREARERTDAIDASVGAMSAADIRRIARPAPADHPDRR